MTIDTNNLYLEQIINESGLKGEICSKSDCTICDNLVKCYMDASRKEDIDENVNYGGYETETHY